MKKLLFIVLFFYLKQINAQCPASVNSSSICAGQTATLTIASPSGNYSWSTISNANFSTAATVTVNPSTTTVYTITSSLCPAMTATVTVNSLTITVNTMTNCLGVTATLTPSGSSANSYTWVPEQTLTAASTPTPIANPTTTTIYTVSGTIGTCITTTTITVPVNKLSIQVLPSTGLPTVLIATGGNAAYTWSPNSFLNANTGSIVVASPTINTVYTVTSGICTTSVTVIANTIKAKIDSLIKIDDDIRLVAPRVDSLYTVIDTLIKIKTDSILSINKKIAGQNRLLPNPTEANSIAYFNSQLLQLRDDSSRLSKLIIGKQKFGVNIALYQSFPTFLDDNNNKSLTQIHLNFNIPFKYKGKKANRIDLKTNTNYTLNGTSWIWFSGCYVGFIANTNPSVKRNFYASDSVNDGKSHVNLMDLKQYAFFNASLTANIVTIINEYYSIYLGGFVTYSRTNIVNANDTIHSSTANFGQYGGSFTFRSKFKQNPIGTINFLFNAQVYWIDPNSSSFVADLNPQYKNVPLQKNIVFIGNNLISKPFGTIGFTLQYQLPLSGANNTSSKSTPNSSSVSGTSPSFFYGYFGYNSNIVIGPQHLHSHNNYMVLQVGYSMDIQTAYNTVKSILGK